ncbi:hypothetical protein FRC17_010048 [Serendipita sp. 399]|nr:hypothetical protein FRC17_010048 [Serendipita sp. 399]
MFVTRLLFAAAASVSTVFAVALEERQSTVDPTLNALANVPPQCTSQCQILQTYSAINPSDLSTLSAVCSSTAQQAFGACIVCFQTYSPQTFTPELLSALNTAAESLYTGCLLVGSPISSVPIPTPTASVPPSGGSGSTTAAGGSASGSASSAPAPSSSASSSGSGGSGSSGQSNGTRQRVRAAAAAIVGVLAPMGLAVFVF